MDKSAPNSWSADARSLFRSLTTEDIVWQDWELALLKAACYSLSNADRAQAELDQAPDWLVEGVRGKQAHPMLAVVREQRALFAQLMAKIEIPGESDDQGWDGAPAPAMFAQGMTRSESATKAARARWAK